MDQKKPNGRALLQLVGRCVVCAVCEVCVVCVVDASMQGG